MTEPADLTVLGGGPAGLATAYFARRAGLSVALLEAADAVGGTCRTFEHEGFRFDSGAHRLHDKDPAVTALVGELLDGDLHRVEAPSRIFDGGRFVEFPLTAGGLLRHLGPVEMARCGLDMVACRWRRPAEIASFEDHAVGQYGRRLAQRYLLSYSEKLWGTRCDQLSPVVAGGRLKGLDLRTFLAESVLRRRRSNHMEGSFLYPRGGIGAIPAAFARAIGDGVIRTGARVTGLVHDDRRITAVAVNGEEPEPVTRVASTLPVSLLPRLLTPAPPDRILGQVARLRFRNVRLVAVLVARSTVTDAATLYFPDGGVPFARVAEPRNRCPSMAPEGRTALVAEVPCAAGDPAWTEPAAGVEAAVVEAMVRIGLIGAAEVLGTTSRRLPAAYPVLDRDAVAAVASVAEWLGGLENLSLGGRGGLFMYGWIHDMVRGGRELVEAITA